MATAWLIGYHNSQKSNAKPSFPKSGSGVVYEMHFLVAKSIQIAKPDSIWNLFCPSLAPFVYLLFFVNIFLVDNLIRFLACVVRIPGTPTLHWKHFSSSPARLKQIGAKKLFGAISFSNDATIYQKKAFSKTCIGKQLHHQHEEKEASTNLCLRFVTGTDFVSSMGPPDQFPGLKGEKANGCMKDKANHARQVMTMIMMVTMLTLMLMITR